MLKNKDKIAQIDGLTGEKDTHGELLQRSIRVALAMRDEGIKYGDFVSVCTFNHLNSCVPHIASFFIGAKIAAIDPNLSVGDALYLLKKLLPKMIFVSLEGVELVEKVIEQLGTDIKIVVFDVIEKHTPFANFLACHQDETIFKPVDISDMNETVMVVFSSGTSEQPKGVCYSHLTMLGRQPREDFPSTLIYGSPFWNVFIMFLHISIVNGGTRIVYPSFDDKNPWKIFEHEVEVAFLNSNQTLALTRTERLRDVNLENIKMLLVGGSYLSMKSKNEIIWALPHVQVTFYYGLSEIFLDVFKTDSHNNNDCVGTIVPAMSYKVVDPETEKALGPNKVGELRIKSKSQCSGYLHKDPASCFDSDGWLKTGNKNNIEALYSVDPKLYYNYDRFQHEDNKNKDNNQNQESEDDFYDLDETKSSIGTISTYPLKKCNNNYKNAVVETTKENGEVEDYGNETRDFIISCLETSYCKEKFPIKVNCSRECGTIGSNIENIQNINPVNEIEEDNISAKIDIESKASKQSIDDNYSSAHCIEKPLPELELQLVPENVQKSLSLKSKLPLLIKSTGKKVAAHKSTVDPKPKDKQIIKLVSIPNLINNSPKQSTKTKWYRNVNKLEFTKNKTSYYFKEYDIHNITDDKIKKNKNILLFGYTS
ncbi:hypothetical protein FQA39_LY17867 [Lamprigera yunnana]|nr:hypothetical protein FQA39_LY17867 [Lamprigera yunnana]